MNGFVREPAVELAELTELPAADYPLLLNALLQGEDLSHAHMLALMRAIMSGRLTPAQIAAVLVALRVKGESVTEIAAAAEVMREMSTRVALEDVPYLVDTCGTGGDGAHTFNISTAAAFVAAAAGVKVAKHGGRSVSSTCGSADVLEALGVNIQMTPQDVARCVREVGIGFMFAANHHSAMKHAAPVRRELGVRTLFNLLGPLTNPAGARHQVIGVYGPHLPLRLAQALHRLGSERVLVVHGAGGLDELSLSGDNQVAELKDGVVSEYTLNPEQLGLAKAELSGLQVANLDAAKAMLVAALRGEDRVASDIVALNAGAAIYVSGLAPTMAEGLARAQEQIHSQRAWEQLQRLIRASEHV